MEIQNESVSAKRKNGCAIALMKRMLIKYSQKHNTTFEEAMMKFTDSPAYDALFDFDTEIWKEGPDYLMQLFEDVSSSQKSA